MFSEYKLKVSALEKELEKFEFLIKFNDLIKNISSMEERFNAEGWTDVQALQEYSKLIKKRNQYITLENSYIDLMELVNLAIEENESDLISEIERDYISLEKDINAAILENMFTGKYDENNVILSVHAGSGGREATDWASMLLRMYIRWAQRNGYKVKTLDSHAGDFPGSIKSAILEISGKNAFGMLKNEAGVHRLVRVSPFDSQGRRHTSFAAIEVIPEVQFDLELNIDPKEIKTDYYRSSGAGGQHVNTTDSAVRVTHLPTGIVVTCQNERSQHQNKDYAMKVLASKLLAIKEKEHYDEISQIQGEQNQIEWGSQIRSYIFMPYQLVKDHRTNHEEGNINAVMDGDINSFIFKSLAN